MGQALGKKVALLGGKCYKMGSGAFFFFLNKSQEHGLQKQEQMGGILTGDPAQVGHRARSQSRRCLNHKVGVEFTDLHTPNINPAHSLTS